MRVAFGDAYPGALYGAQRMLLALMGALPAHGIAPVLIAAPGALAEAAAAAGVEVRQSAPPPALRGPLRPSLRSAVATARYGLALGPLLADCDAVVGNQIRAVLTLAPAALTRRVPLVWYLRRPYRAGVANLAALAVSSGIVAVADTSREVFSGWARRVCDRKAETIPDGLDPAVWRPRDRTAARRALDLAPDAAVVATVATITPNKGHDLLLEAAARLVAEFPRLVVLVAGDAASPADAAHLHGLRERAAGLPVRFLGFRDDVREVVAAADVAVLPSREEGLPGALLEAMSLERPVVATATAGARTVLDGGGGTLVPLGDLSALAQAIAAYLRDPAYAARTGAAGRARVAQAYTLDETARRVAAFLRRVAHQSASA